VAPIEPQSPRKLLVTLDGSAQDAMSLAVADALRSRFGCALEVLDGRDWVQSNELAEQAAQSLGAQALDKQEGDSYEQILAAVQRSQSDLAIVPSPFGRDLEKVGSDSTGTVVDVLLARSPVPLLIVRQVYDLEKQPFQRAVMVLIGENEAAPAAARWMTGLIDSQGRIELLLVLEDEVLENVRSLMHSLDPNAEVTAETLGEALERSQVRLHRALQKAVSQLGGSYRLNVRRESDVRLAELADAARRPLLVLAHERSDHSSQGHVHDRIRHSPHLVLVTSVD
jgi:hypothetical protein